MNSSGHKANILNKNYRQIGIGVVYGDYKSSEVTVWTALRHPLARCPNSSTERELDGEGLSVWVSNRDNQCVSLNASHDGGNMRTC